MIFSLKDQLACLRASKNPRHNERGFFIGPALGAVAVVLLTFVVVWGIYRFINNQLSIYIESNNLQAIVQGADSLSQGGSYANVSNTTLQTIQAFGNMTGAAVGGTVMNKWGGAVTVTGSASNVLIEYDNVPAYACQGFLNRAADSNKFDSASMPTCNSSGTSNLTFTHY
ncbi:type 4 pilus major pilin [Bordetella sp. FB-8]|uniref:type 4 pilus major pilin n=1 Tax=Bordetella sp. FB-8 TaxID=1159870 RepID=UPI00036E079A|nr:type 4 pilus major pilin [Bordetella sp. FB-8]